MISVAVLGEVAKFDAAAERALRTFRRNAIIKVDTQNCAQCGELDNYWNTVDSQLPRGNMWRADCTADSPPALCAARWQTGQPRFEAWDGEKFELFAGKPDIQTLNQWAIASLRHFSPPARLAAESPDMGSSKGTLFVSPTQEGTAAQTANPQIPFAQFSVYGDAFPALARTLGREIGDDGASVVDVGCGHGLLVEAQRAMGRKSYCVEGSADAYDAWPHAYRDEFYSVQDFAVDGATLPPTEIVTSFEVGEHLPPATAFVEMLTAHSPRLVFFGAATVRQDSQLVNGRWVSMNPTHVNEQPFAYWVERFAAAGYALDAARAARLRVALFADPGYQKALQTCRAWWYAKNLLVFRRVTSAADRAALDAELARAPATAAGHFAALFDGDAAAGEHAAALYGSHLATVPGHPCEGRDIDWMWRRDNDEFAALYARERDAAVARIRGGHADPEWDEARERDEL